MTIEEFLAQAKIADAELRDVRARVAKAEAALEEAQSEAHKVYDRVSKFSFALHVLREAGVELPE
jgi:hypothetical protein